MSADVRQTTKYGVHTHHAIHLTGVHDIVHNMLVTLFHCRPLVQKACVRRHLICQQEVEAHRSIHELTPLPFGRGSVMLYASHVKLPPRYSAKIGTPRALACSNSSSTSTPVQQSQKHVRNRFGDKTINTCMSAALPTGAGNMTAGDLLARP